jgi:hypothetical protein
MNITFGITTDYSSIERLDSIINSINLLNIPKYEILIIGNKKIDSHGVVNYIEFDESIKPLWITKKKNIMIQEAKYDNVVLFHDYFLFDPMWYQNYLKFGDDWDLCSNEILLMNGRRWGGDWMTWDDPLYEKYAPLHYDDWTRTEYMFVAGSYFIVKKELGLREPLNENLGWGDSEDVEWSLRIRNKCIMKCNGKSSVKHNKIHRDINHGYDLCISNPQL